MKYSIKNNHIICDDGEIYAITEMSKDENTKILENLGKSYNLLGENVNRISYLDIPNLNKDLRNRLIKLLVDISEIEDLISKENLKIVKPVKVEKKE